MEARKVADHCIRDSGMNEICLFVCVKFVSSARLGLDDMKPDSKNSFLCNRRNSISSWCTSTIIVSATSNELKCEHGQKAGPEFRQAVAGFTLASAYHTTAFELKGWNAH